MQASVTPLLGELLRSAARRHPSHDAIVFPDHRLSYAGFSDESHTIARALVARGVRPGDHIGILATNRPEYLPLLFACVVIGAVAVLLNARFRTQELRHVVRHCDLKWIVTGNLHADPNAERLLEALSNARLWNSLVTQKIFYIRIGFSGYYFLRVNVDYRWSCSCYGCIITIFRIERIIVT